MSKEQIDRIETTIFPGDKMKRTALLGLTELTEVVRLKNMEAEPETVSVTLRLYPEVARFATLMQQELERHVPNKGWGWTTAPTSHLQRLLRDQLRELEITIWNDALPSDSVLKSSSGELVAPKAADVANFTMMLAVTNGELMKG